MGVWHHLWQSSLPPSHALCHLLTYECGQFLCHYKRLLPYHAEVDRRLIHVEDETSVVMWALEEWAHELHVIQFLRRGVLGLALCFVRAHTIH